MCLHPNTELGKAPMALHFEEKKCLSTPEPTPLNKVQQKGHSTHLGFSRMGIKLFFFFLKDGSEPQNLALEFRDLGSCSFVSGAKFYFKNISGGVFLSGRSW